MSMQENSCMGKISPSCGWDEPCKFMRMNGNNGENTSHTQTHTKKGLKKKVLFEIAYPSVQYFVWDEFKGPTLKFCGFFCYTELLQKNSTLWSHQVCCVSMLTLWCSCIAVDRWHCDTCRCQGQTGWHGQVHRDAEKPLWRGNIDRQRQRPWWVDRFFLSFYGQVSVSYSSLHTSETQQGPQCSHSQHTREIHMHTTHRLRVTVGDSHTCLYIPYSLLV